MEEMNKTICDECMCWAICGIYRATSGVKHCKYFSAGSPHAKMERAKEPVNVLLTMQCGRCGAHVLEQDHVCSSCGAILDRE